MLSLLPGVHYAARVSVGDPGLVGKAKQAIRRAFEVQLEGNGFSLVEVLSTCPVGWGLTPSEAMDTAPRGRDGRLPRRDVRRPVQGDQPGDAPAGRPGARDHGGVLMERSTIIAGFGGQGILFAGKVLAQAALHEGREVLWIPSYGPEMRGGTASCTVIIADRPIGSPVVDRADAAVVLNPPSLAKYEPAVAPGGVLVINTTLIEAEPARTRPRRWSPSRARPSRRRPATRSSCRSWRSGRWSVAAGWWSPRACTAPSRPCWGRSARS